MKKKYIFFLFILFFLSSCFTKESGFVENNFDFASKQLIYALSEMDLAIKHESEESIHERAENNRSELSNPRSVREDGSLLMVSSNDWCSGFFPGELWYMYEFTGENKWKDLAHRQTILIEREKYNKHTHDMGFKMYCSYGNAYRLTGNESYRHVLIQSAKTLISRFNPNVGCIRSWDFNRENWNFPVIIDNMMNLELLFWAAKETGDSTFYNIAVSHAETTIKNHFREDNSSYHVIDYDPETGEVRKKNTHQGYSDESAWARGQAWAIYGYTMCYRETGIKAFLEQAEKTAQYIFTHPNLPQDLIPYWDYNAPEIPNEPRDVSSAACTASALYELSLYSIENGDQYMKWADSILENLSNNYRATLGNDRGFLLLHSTGSKPGNFEVDKPLIYADYYFLEALLRKHKLKTKN